MANRDLSALYDGKQCVLCGAVPEGPAGVWLAEHVSIHLADASAVVVIETKYVRGSPKRERVVPTSQAPGPASEQIGYAPKPRAVPRLRLPKGFKEWRP